jgi:hypothetical protein
MNVYTLMDNEEIYCDGVLMTPKEILLKLQMADMLASFILQNGSDGIIIPTHAVESIDDFTAWIDSITETDIEEIVGIVSHHFMYCEEDSWERAQDLDFWTNEEVMKYYTENLNGNKKL